MHLSRLIPGLPLVIVACASGSPSPPVRVNPAPSASAPLSSASASASSSASAVPAREPLPPGAPAKRIAIDTMETTEGVRVCAVLQDGGVACWGGKVHAAPHRVPGISDAVDVSVGGEVIVVKADGTAVMLKPDDLTAPPRPFVVKKVRSVSQMQSRACAIADDGTPGCWDLDERQARVARAFPVKGVQDPVQIGAGGGYGCALQKNGRVACWEFGRMSYLVPKLDHVVDLQMGFEEACARKDDGSVTCWLVDPHKNVMSQLENADAVGLYGTWTKGYGAKDLPFACTASQAGVSCGHLDKLGDDGQGAYQKTGLVEGTRGLKVRQLAVARTASCALDDKGQVHCWGHNSGALLGQPDPGYVEQFRPVPGLPPMKAIVAGWYSSCGLTQGGEVLCWGPKPKDMGLRGMARLAGNNCCTCAYTASGEASCFEHGRTAKRSPAFDTVREVVFSTDVWDPVAAVGRSDELLIGQERDLGKLTFETVKGIGAVQRVSVSLPGGTVFAQEKSGQVWAIDRRQGKRPAPIRIPKLDKVISMDQSGNMLLPGGKLVEVALREKLEVLTVTESTPLVSLLGPWKCGLTQAGAFGCLWRSRVQILFEGEKSIAAGTEHQCVLSDEGVVRCRGDNQRGQCGEPEGLKESGSAVQVRLPGP